MKRTIKVLFPIIGIFLVTNIYAQSLTPDVYSTSGDYYQGSNASISWTLGEVVIETFSSSTSILTQGFQQPSYVITSLKENPEFKYDIKVYPNPSSDILNIKVMTTDLSELNIVLYDLNGKKLLEQKVMGQETQLNLFQYTEGTYILKLSTLDNNDIKVFKIQKFN